MLTSSDCNDLVSINNENARVLSRLVCLAKFNQCHNLLHRFHENMLKESRGPYCRVRRAAPAPSPAVAPDDTPDGAQLLYRAFAAVVIAMAVESAEVLLSILYRAVV